MNPVLLTFVVGLVAGLAAIPLCLAAFRALTIQVEDGENVLLTHFGKLAQNLKEPGLYFVPSKALPWVKVHRVWVKRDFRDFRNVHVNDSRGTTVVVDLWLEFRIVDPAKALFQVADWDRSLQNLAAHAATSILGNRDFRQILCDRTELGEVLKRDICAETERWGLEIELAFIRNVNLLPEISRQIFESIAARLERAKADIDERGRLAVAQLEANTSVDVAQLVAEAKAQYPAAVGRALARLRTDSQVYAAYNELYELSLVRPHRTIAFSGFGEELRAVDAGMLAPVPVPEGGRAPALVSHLREARDKPLGQS